MKTTTIPSIQASALASTYQPIFGRWPSALEVARLWSQALVFFCYLTIAYLHGNIRLFDILNIAMR